MKKTLSLILALLMTASSASFVFADDVEAIAAIDDEAVVEEEVVVEETEYDDAIRFLQAYKILQGKEDGLLHAEDGIKRYEMALLTGRVATGWVDNKKWEDGIANNSKFADLEGTAAEDFLGAISYADQKGIIEGYEDGTFKPEKGITYREALTMAVRTLGYQGLEWPWGYIEEAVSSGLTNGISGVAYTEEVNRGVISQIIYNMMFAKTKNGDTLAMRSFGVDFGWQNIIITANSKSTYEAKAGKTKAGVVGFRVLNNDGTLDDKTYYIQDAEGAYELGKVYNALFELDKDADFVNVIGSAAYAAEAIVNKGLTDDEGVEYEDANFIGEFLDDYTLVSKYSASPVYINNSIIDEIIVKNGTNDISVLEGYDYKKGMPYVVDWATGNILKKYVDVDDRDNDFDTDEFSYEVEWYYSAKLEGYYKLSRDYDKYPYDPADDDAFDSFFGSWIPVGIQVMEAEDAAALKDAVKAAAEVKKNYDGYKTITEVPNTAYALLEVYDLDGDDFADYALYESYRFGKFEVSNKKCDKCGKDVEAYKFVTLGLASDSEAKYIAEGACDHHKIKDGKVGDLYSDSYVFAEGYEPSVNADGDYVAGYVIYGVNEGNNEIKIIKEIGKLGENDDIDSYYATGVVRGYSMNGDTVTIDDTVLKYDYSTLNGTAFVDVKDNKKAYTTAFDKLFNNFVEYVVVDGKLVYVKTIGGTNSNYIVVESYAGIDSDGYIVVNGYSTDKLEYDQFRIGSYNGWKRGDFFWYKDAIEDEFVKGSVYKITSADKDAENGVIYYVENLSHWNDKNQRWEWDSKVEGGKSIKITFDDAYRFVEYDGAAAKTKRMSANDKYIIIGDVKGNGNEDTYGAPIQEKWSKFMPIYVYEGKVNLADDYLGWCIEGTSLVGDAGSSTFIIVNPTKIVGFDRDTTKTGFVAILEKKITERNYNGYGESYYLYGATQYTCEAFNLLSGKSDEVRVGTNIDLEEGRIYTTIDDTIIDIDGKQDMRWIDFKYDLVELGAYTETDLDIAEYRFFYDYAFGEQIIKYVDGKNNDKEEFSSDVVAKALFGVDKTYKDLVEGLKVFYVATGEFDEIVDIKSINSTKDFKKYFDEDDHIEMFVIYHVEDEKAVVYIEKTWSVTHEDLSPVADSSNRITLGNDIYDAFIDAKVDYDVVKETVGKGTDEEYTYYHDFVVNNIEFYFNGGICEGTLHQTIEDGLWFFDYDNACSGESWNATNKWSDEAAADIINSFDSAIYANHDTCHAGTNGAPCDMIKAVKITNLKKALENRTPVYYTLNFKTSTGVEFNFVLKLEATEGNGKLDVEFYKTDDIISGTYVDSAVGYVKNALVD